MALNAFCRALGTVFGGLRNALVEVVRDGEVCENESGDSASFHNSPCGDGRDGPRVFLKMHETHDLHS